MTGEEERAVRERVEADWRNIEDAKAELESCCLQLCARLSRESGVRHRHWVEARSKTLPSILRKLSEKNLGADDIYNAIGDLVGARVVVYNLSDAQAVRDALIAPDSPIVNPVDEDITRPNGYRAIHINGRIGPYGCEIQIRTVVQDAWAVTSRADLYRSETDILVSKLSGAQASILQGVDEVLQAVRDLTERSHKGVADAESEPSEPESVEHDGAQTPEPREGLDGSLVQEARDALEPDERYVMESPTSQTRIDALRAGVESKRQAGAIGRIFRAASRFERVYEYRASYRFGNRMTVWKGPFVEGSSWVEFQPRDFSQALEAFLELQFGDALRSDMVKVPSLASWQETSEFILQSIEGLNTSGGRADLLVIQGRPEEAFNMDMLRSGDWREIQRIRGIDVWDSGPSGPVIHGLPLVTIQRRDASPSIHVVDLDQFQYEQTNPDAMTNSDLLLRLDPYNFEAAAELVDRDPGIKKWLYSANHQGQEGEYTREEAVVRLLLQVKLHVVEGGKIRRIGGLGLPSALLPPEPTP
jgi:ppGpp synthetase/RelA/SpoT-type nucleotidyltranferase